MLYLIEWLPVGEPGSEAAGALGRKHLPANPGIDTPDLLLGEVAERQGALVLTTNVKHFREMFPGIRAPNAY
jgi:predicted nucleic acid-binding protein